MKKITLSDIARETGFSVNTVSHALKDKPDISRETKKYINDTANAMGYIPNVSAGALRGGKTMSIAIIVSDISNPHFAIMVKEMEIRLREYGYSAFIMNTEEDEALERAAIISALSKNADGIIICPVQKTGNNSDFLEKKEIPYISVERRSENSNVPYVICDDSEGGFCAAKHLLELGHSEILFLNAPDYISGARDRLAGIKNALKEYSLPEENLHVETIGLTNGENSIEKVLSKNSDCSAVICFSDILAMEVCRCLKLQGKSVPDDISIVGFDNISSRYPFPLTLTSVSTSKAKMSVQAVDTLINIIDGKESATQIILPTKLIEGESTKKAVRVQKASKRSLSDYLL